MTTTQQPPDILAVNPDGIPQFMRRLKRWGVWVATWIPERGKYDKRPVNPMSGVGLSSKRPQEWATFEQAWAAYKRNPGLYAGMGFVIVKGDNIFCADQDKCIRDGTPDARSRDVVQTLDSFTEYSPSGQGLHTWGKGSVSQDCVKGIELYQGNSARYVTVTGLVPAGAPVDMREVVSEVLESIIDTYGHRSTASGESSNAPEILDPLALPDTQDLELPYAVTDFLNDGSLIQNDRSNTLWSTAIALHKNGLTSQEVFSLMANNPHAWGAAMGKRGEDEDKAVEYLWEQQACKAKAKADSTRVTLDDFDEVPDIEPDVEPDAPTDSVADAFDDVSAEAGATPKGAKRRFQFLQMATFMAQTKRLSWLVHGVLPKAEVGVIYGDSGSGKSFFVFDLLMSVALGSEWRGISARQGNVAYVVAEGASGFPYRVQAYAEAHGIDPATVPFHLVGEAPNLMEKADTKELVKELKLLGNIDVIVLDTMAQVTPGADENSGQDMGRALSHCKAIHKATGAMVLLVAHTGKDASRGIRGWSGIKGALDVEILVEKAGHQRAATITKMKDGEGEGREYLFKLDIVNLGEYTDDGGEIRQITSCVLKHGASHQTGTGPEKLTRQEHKDALERVETLLELAAELPLQTVVDAIADIQTHPEKKNRNKAARRIVDVLIRSRHLRVDDDVVRRAASE